MKDYKWNFSKKNEPDQNLLDPFSDSKFNINCVASFTREIIQNSLDAKNNEILEPVKMAFELKSIAAKDIPGLEQLLLVLEQARKNIQHKETANKFDRAIEELKKDKIECLKVSDYNTIGMNESRWDALLFKEGISDKSNDSSAGRHGVGKKASFLMSLCNTVYYATKNTDGKMFFGGKSILVDWQNLENEWCSSKGWYGKKEINSNDIECVSGDKIALINDFFARKDKYGSDVIVLAPRKVNSDYSLEQLIISSILENFFIGICEKKIEVKVNSIKINSNNIDDIIDKYYISNFKSRESVGANVTYGLLKDFQKAYLENKTNPQKIPMKIDPDDENEDSCLDIYLTLDTEQTRKYYSFYRDHGMKIKDERYGDANRSFSAIVVARGEKLNEFLLNLENAAHDDFIIDENATDDEKKKQERILTGIRNRIYHIISKATKLEVSDEIELEELNEMIDNPGEIGKKVGKNTTSRNTRKVKPEITIQTKTKKKTKGEWGTRPKPLDPIPYPNPGPKPISSPDPRPLPYPTPTPDDDDINNNPVLRDIAYEKMLITLHNCYYMQFLCAYNLQDVSIQVTAKNVDDSVNDVGYMLDSIEWNGKKYESRGNNFIKLGDLAANEEMKLLIYLKDQSRYKLFAKIVGKTYDEN